MGKNLSKGELPGQTGSRSLCAALLRQVSSLPKGAKHPLESSIGTPTPMLRGAAGHFPANHLKRRMSMKKTHLPFRLLSPVVGADVAVGLCRPRRRSRRWPRQSQHPRGWVDAGGKRPMQALATWNKCCNAWSQSHLPHSRQHLPDKQLRQAPSGGAVDPRNRFYRGGGRQHRHLERLRIQPCHSGQRTPESGRAAGSRSEGSGPAVQI